MVGVIPPTEGSEIAAPKVRQVLLAHAGETVDFDLTTIKGNFEKLRETWTNMGIHEEKIGNSAIEGVTVRRSVKSMLGNVEMGTADMFLPIEMVGGKRTVLLMALVVSIPFPGENINVGWAPYRARSFKLPSEQ